MISDKALFDAGASKVVRIGDCLLIRGNCLDIMPAIGGVDAVITDPPYGINIDDFDGGIDIRKFVSTAIDILPSDAWFVWFGQMPTMIDWITVCNENNLRWSDHIAWVKRTVTAIALPLNRSHESVFSYRKGKPKHFKKKGPYGDVKVELLHTMPEFIEGVKRQLSESGRRIQKTSNTKQKSYDYMSGIAKVHTGGNSPVNFTNVWSFSPGNLAAGSGGRSRGKGGEAIQHATVKPTKLMVRLVEVFAGQDQTILDPFMGSGTTLVACAELGRSGIGIELDPKYFEEACKRVREAYERPDLFTPPIKAEKFETISILEKLGDD